MRMLRLLCLSPLLFLWAGCGDPAGDGPYGDGDGSPITGDFNWCTIRDSILTPECASCHQGAAPSGGVDLSGDPYTHIVGVASSVAGVNYINPGDPDTSYLFLKMSGRQAEVGGAGSTMPLSGPVDQSLLDGIETWILAGASQSCDGGGTPQPATPTQEPATPGATPNNEPGLFCRVQDEVFTASCAFSGCHAGNKASGGLNLEAGLSYSNLVGVNSSQVTSMLRVKAGDSGHSYLMNKLHGTAGDVGGVNTLMPLGNNNPLPQEQLDLVAAWIDDDARLACGTDETPPPTPPLVTPTPEAPTPTAVPTPEPTPLPPTEVETRLAIIGTESGAVWAIDTRDGVVIWTWIGEDHWIFGSPFITGSRVWVVGIEGHVSALNLATGDEELTFDLGGAPTTTITPDGEDFWIMRDDNTLFQVDTSEGTPDAGQWVEGGAVGAMSLSDGWLVGTNKVGGVFGINVGGAEEPWAWAGSGLTASSSPVAADGYALVGVKGNGTWGLLSLEIDTGDSVRTGTMSSVVEVQPTYVDHTVLAVSTPGQARLFGTYEGNAVWTAGLFDSGTNSVAAAAAADTLNFYVTLSGGQVVALARANGDAAWEEAAALTGAATKAPATGLDGDGYPLVVAGDTLGGVTALDVANGGRAWQVDLGSAVTGAPAFSGLVTVERLTPPPGAYSYKDVQGVFAENCSCHTYDASGGLGMGINAENLYAATVNVASNGVPSLDYIEPGDVGNSYLWRKLVGSQEEVGGSGASMPLAKPSLSAADLAGIKGWIQGGAPLK